MLDTLKYSKRLQEAEFSPPQAEAQEGLWEAIEGTVATKQDLELLRQEMNGKFAELEIRIDGRFNELEIRIDGRFNELEARFDGRLNGLESSVDGRFRLLYWMVGFNLALTVGVLLKLFIG